MKKIILLMKILSLSQLSLCQTLDKAVTQIYFGRYGLDCSSGTGASSFTVSKSNAELGDLKYLMKIADNSVLLELDKNSITKEEQVSIFGTLLSEINPNETTFFIQQDSILLSESTLKDLQINPKYSSIPSGNYPMIFTGDKVQIIFTLKVPNASKN